MFSLSSPTHSNVYFGRYIPQTPSPLRTSQNANRLAMSNALMSSPLSENWRDGDENWSPTANKVISVTPSTKFPASTPNVDSWERKTPVTTTPSSSSHTFTPVSDTSFTSTSTSSGSSTARFTFAYESRARSSSPAAQISKHAMDCREQRKTQFLDKIRLRRRESRDERMEEKVLRMDFVKERRIWEEEMSRRADIEKEADEAADTEMDIGEVEEHEVGGVSPTEEREIEELISYLNEDELGDDGYEELFMEMLGQEQQGDQMDMS